MVKYLDSSLVDVMYIVDEPSVGPHPRDIHRLNELLVKLRDKGNTSHERWLVESGTISAQDPAVAERRYIAASVADLADSPDQLP